MSCAPQNHRGAHNRTNLTFPGYGFAVISEGRSTAPVNLRSLACDEDPTRTLYWPGNASHLPGGFIEVSKRTLVQFQCHNLRLIRLKEDFLEALQFLDWSADSRILLADVQLGDFCPGAFPGICNYKAYSNLTGAVPCGWRDLQIGKREVRVGKSKAERK